MRLMLLALLSYCLNVTLLPAFPLCALMMLSYHSKRWNWRYIKSSSN